MNNIEPEVNVTSTISDTEQNTVERVIDDNPIVIDEDPSVTPSESTVVKQDVVTEDDKKDDEEASDEQVQVTGKSNFVKSADYSKPIKEFTGNHEQLYFQTSTYTDTQQRIESASDPKMAEDPKSAEWLRTMIAGMDSATHNDGFAAAAGNPDALWVQEIESGIGQLKAGTPIFKSRPGTEYTGEAKRLRFRSQIGMGTAFSVPLWHSGFWITVKTPSEGELLELYRELASGKVEIGRATYGLMYSNLTYYRYKILLDFALRHLYGCSLSIKDDDNIKNYIDVRDIQHIVWAMICATWPKGVEYARACIANPDKCRHIVREHLNPAKLQVTDSVSVNERQRQHMTKRSPNSMTVDEVKLYRAETLKGVDKRIQLTDECFIILKTPNVVDYIEAGDAWVDSIEEKYALSLLEDEKERERYLTSHAKATAMRQYAHYVGSIAAGDLSYTEKKDIYEALDDLSSDDKFRDLFIDSVTKFIDDSVFSMIAIPTYKCPNCGEEQSPYKDRGVFSSVLPLEVANDFFMLVVQKISNIEGR